MSLPGSIETREPSPILERLAQAIPPDIPIKLGNGAAAIDEDFDRLDHLLDQQEER